MSTKRKALLKQYRGPLSAIDVAAGMNAAARNARRLLADAKLSLSERRIASACALAILSIEEAGKLPLLRTLSTASTEADLKRSWRAYRDHRAKNAAWIVVDLVREGARSLTDLSPIFDPDSDHTDTLDAVKQVCLYTDCCGERHWSEPSAVIDEGLAASIVKTAEALCPKKDVSVREIELWVREVGPFESLKQARLKLVRFYEAMDKEGLARGTLDGWKDFVLEPERRT